MSESIEPERLSLKSADWTPQRASGIQGLGPKFFQVSMAARPGMPEAPITPHLVPPGSQGSAGYGVTEMRHLPSAFPFLEACPVLTLAFSGGMPCV